MPNCRPDVQAFLDQAGCEIEGGSIVALAFIEDSVTFTDITDPSEWVGLTYASDILIYKEVRGSYPKAAATEIPGKGKQDIRITGRKHVANVRVGSIKGNEGHWNQLNQATNYKVAFVIGGNYDLLYFVDTNVSINASSVVEEGLDTEVDWDVEIKWSDKNLPSTSDVPAGIFE